MQVYTVIGRNYNFYRDHYSLRQVHPAIDMEDMSLVDCLHTLIMSRSNEVTVERFGME